MMHGGDWLMLGVLCLCGLMSLLVCAVDHLDGRAEARRRFPNNPALW